MRLHREAGTRINAGHVGLKQIHRRHSYLITVRATKQYQVAPRIQPPFIDKHGIDVLKAYRGEEGSEFAEG
jgi:hypothetical protein